MATERPRALVLVAAGGTGGHLYPGIAVADELRRRDPALRVVFAGSMRGLESRLVPRAGYELERLPILPLNGVGLGRALLGAIALPWGLLQAARLVWRLRPVSVLGVGGYAGGPVVLMAALLGVRTVILEPNARPGFTNRVLRPFVARAACAYEETRLSLGSKAILTGTPVRREFADLPPRAYRSPLRLLAFGGSQGSRTLNAALLAAVPQLPGPERLSLVHQTGAAFRDEVAAGYARLGRPAEVTAFLDDMPSRFAAADIVLARSGATTCAEITAAGKAAVLVPFARAADDHQRVNAAALAAAGAARMLEEHELSGETLAGVLSALVEAPERIAEMAAAARRLARPHAARDVADLLMPEAAGPGSGACV